MGDKERLLGTVMQVVGPHLDGISEERIKRYLSQHFEAYEVTANRSRIPFYEYQEESSCTGWGHQQVLNRISADGTR